MSASAKERFLDWVYDRWIDFKSRGIYFQVKVGMVAIYALIVVATVLVVPPRAPDYVVAWELSPFGMSYVTYIEMQNNDLGSYERVKVMVFGDAVDFEGNKKGGKWTGAFPFREGAENRVLVKPDDLKGDDGFRAPNHIEVTQVKVIDADTGDVILDLNPPPRKKSKRK